MKHRTAFVLVAAILGLALVATLPAAAQNGDASIGYRQKVMGAIGANMGSIGDIMKFKLPHQANIPAHAEAIRTSAKLIPSAFEKRVTEGPTDAKAKIWDNWSDFKDKAADLEEAGAKLASVARGNDMGATMDAVKNVGEACKACHKEYRKPKEESYKRM